MQTKATIGGVVATPPAATEDLGFALRLAQMAVFKDLIRVLEPYELRPPLYTALSLISARPGLEQHELGGLLHVLKPNLVALVEELYRRGLITRERRARSYALHLTHDGEALLARLQSATADHRRRVSEAAGGAAAHQTIVDGLRRLADRL